MDKSLKIKLINELIDREGGFVNHPHDRGGPTNHGITLAVARRNGWRGDIRDMPREFAFNIYERKYWTSLSLDSITHPRLQVSLFDFCVHSGASRPGKALQRCLNVLNRMGTDYGDIAVDGKVGPNTIGALNALVRHRGPDAYQVVANMVDGLRQTFLIGLAERSEDQETFSYGWAHRVMGLS